MTAIIIDDIPQAIQNLQADLTTYCPDVQVIGTADGVVSGSKLLRKKKADLLFLDIQLQDGTGFDILEILPQLSAKVIFTTASDAFAIKAFRFAAVDYLLKPVDPDELQEAVQKAQQQSSQQERFALLQDSFQDQQLPQRLALHTLDKIHIVQIKDIIRCESSGNYTTFYFQNGQKLLVTKTLKEYDKLLKEHQFIRVHQSHLVNMEQIREYVKTDGGYLVMQDGTPVSVSMRRKGMVMKVLSQF